MFILVGLLPFLIISSIMTWHRRVCIPFCGQHAGYWKRRAAVMIGGFFGLILVAVFLGAAGPDVLRSPWLGYAWIALGVIALGWLFAAAILQSMSIRPIKISVGLV